MDFTYGIKANLYKHKVKKWRKKYKKYCLGRINDIEKDISKLETYSLFWDKFDPNFRPTCPKEVINDQINDLKKCRDDALVMVDYEDFFNSKYLDKDLLPLYETDIDTDYWDGCSMLID